jgi:hypothetical protein
MKTINRRLRRLEERLAPARETEFDRRLRERIELAYRVAEARERSESGPPRPDDYPHAEFWHEQLLQATIEAERAVRLGRRNSYRY